MDRMNPLDASFLHVEDGISHMHIASCAVFAGPPPPFDELVSYMAAKVSVNRRYRQKVRFVPFDLGRPVWVDDPHFNLAYHVRHTALPAPGDEAALNALMGRLMSQELDRDHPLWEWWIVEGLAGDHWALIPKVHHCMVDGVAGVDMIEELLDPTPVVDPRVLPMAEWKRPASEPSGAMLTAVALAERAVSPYEYVRGVRALARRPRLALERARLVAGGLAAYASAARATPKTSLDGPIGPHRTWVPARTHIDDVKQVRTAFGGTVNDVVLSAIAGGFRDLVIARREDPAIVRMRSLVPVSVRAPDAHGVYDNRVSAIFFELPIGIADPVERLRAVSNEMVRLKASHEPEAGEVVTQLLGMLPPEAVQPALRLSARLVHRLGQRTLNTVTTNVPGPRERRYLYGCEMVDYLPYVPISHGVRIGVAILSYAGQIGFGITGDLETAPDVDVVARGIESTMAELVKEAQTTQSTGDRGSGE